MPNPTPDLLRARELAAADYGPGSIPARAILNGWWDQGSVVRRHLARLEGEGRT